MAWAITADPQRFDEACEYFLSRTVITANEAARLDDDSRQRAFWVGGGLQLTQVQRVFDALNEAIAKGEPFKDFQARMAKTLRDPVHTETVFRNAAQRAFMAGRYRQMREVQKYRPYWRTNAILDGRTSPVCKPLALKPVIRLASDPWWLVNWPPRHHRCRLQVESLRAADAQRLGITTELPDVEPSGGFGRAPDNDPIWRPDPTKHDPALLAELEAKQRRAPRPKKVKAKPEHDPAHWASEYAHLGDAAPPAAYGRAMAERALDRKPREVRDELERLKDAGFPGLEGFQFRGLEELDQDKPLRATTWAQLNHGLLALSEHTRSIRPGKAPQIRGDNPRAVSGAKRFYHLAQAKSVKWPSDWTVEVQNGVRAYASPRGKRVVLGDPGSAAVAVHEIAHAIEFSDERALRRSLAFLNARTKGEAARKLAEIFPGRRYDDLEVAREDKFLSGYMGKDYGLFATEITSMGYEQLVRDPEELGQRDREMLYFLLGQLAGK